MRSETVRRQTALRDLPSRPIVILSRRRRISVLEVYESIGSKYRSAGRLPFGSQFSVEYQFGLPRCTPLRHFVALFP